MKNVYKRHWSQEILVQKCSIEYQSQKLKRMGHRKLWQDWKRDCQCHYNNEEEILV